MNGFSYALEKEENMYYITTETSFDAAHFLSGYPGKCKNIHGHRWRVLIKIKSEQLKSDSIQNGMICDFSDLKKDLKSIVDKLDHSFIFEKDSLKPELIKLLLEEQFSLHEVPFRPTAENFSFYFYQEMQKRGYEVAEATVYETPNNYASYHEEVS